MRGRKARTGREESAAEKGRTVVGYDLDDVDLVARRDELLPPADEEPVVTAVDPVLVERIAPVMLQRIESVFES